MKRKNLIIDLIRDEANSRMANIMMSRVWRQMINQASRQLHAEARNKVWSELDVRLRRRVEDQVGEQLRNSL